MAMERNSQQQRQPPNVLDLIYDAVYAVVLAAVFVVLIDLSAHAHAEPLLLLVVLFFVGFLVMAIRYFFFGASFFSVRARQNGALLIGVAVTAGSLIAFLSYHDVVLYFFSFFPISVSRILGVLGAYLMCYGIIGKLSNRNAAGKLH